MQFYFLAGLVRGRLHQHRRWILIAAFLLQGVAVIGGGVIPHLGLALGVWLLHDMVGAGIWLPIRGELLQRYCRPQSRASDTAMALAR